MLKKEGKWEGDWRETNGGNGRGETLRRVKEAPGTKCRERERERNEGKWKLENGMERERHEGTESEKKEKGAERSAG